MQDKLSSSESLGYCYRQRLLRAPSKRSFSSLFTWKLALETCFMNDWRKKLQPSWHFETRASQISEMLAIKLGVLLLLSVLSNQQVGKSVFLCESKKMHHTIKTRVPPICLCISTLTSGLLTFTNFNIPSRAAQLIKTILSLQNQHAQYTYCG